MPYGTRRAPTTESILPPLEIREKTAERRAWLAAKLEEVTAEGRIAKIVGTGSYQALSIKLGAPRATKTMLVGLCQCCGRQIGATTGAIAHHGYTRQDGWQTRSCAGARYLPLEESTGRAEELARVLTLEIERLEAHLVTLPTAERISATVRFGRGYRAQPRFVTVDRANAEESLREAAAIHDVRRLGAFEFMRQSAEAQAKAEVRGMRGAVTELLERIEKHRAGAFVGTTREVEVPA